MQLFFTCGFVFVVFFPKITFYCCTATNVLLKGLKGTFGYDILYLSYGCFGRFIIPVCIC